MIDALGWRQEVPCDGAAGDAAGPEGAAANGAPAVALWAPDAAGWTLGPVTASAGGRFRAVTARLEEAIERRSRRLAARVRLRRLVEDIDMVIAACERAHLAGFHEVGGEVVAGAREVWDEAAEVFGELGDGDAQRLVERVSSARAIWVHELMDRLWAVQDAAFDLLVPWRRRLRDSERDGEEEAPWSDGVPA